ncbi:MAG: bile acid:sodium symporter family protein [Cyanobacteriota bacterium]|nr:bile acid:sodium symporter family protein [Cyanobacteriota bacterium]
MENSLLTTVLLPLALAFIMLGMGLGLVPDDFRRIGRNPKAITVGVLSQMVVLPLIGVLIVALVPMPPVIAVGLVVVALCPGGPSSNLITYLAKGDVALSVSLTALSSLLTVVTIPVLANLALRWLLGTEAEIRLPIGTTMLQILLITLVPTAGGMALRRRWPATALRLERQVSRLAAGFLALIILVLLVREGHRLPSFLWKAGLGVVLLNGLGTLAGALAGRGAGLPRAQQIALAVEVGIQNCTLAIAITAGLLRNPEMAVPAALYGLWMNAAGLAVVHMGRRLAAGGPSTTA